jgi:hypothetical protein
MSVPRARRRWRAREAVPPEFGSTGEPANQTDRPAYAKLDEDRSDGPSRASTHRGRIVGKHRLAFVAFDGAKGSM